MFSLDDPEGGRREQLERLIEDHAEEGCSLWVDYSWDESVDEEAALKRQEEISEFVQSRQLNTFSPLRAQTANHNMWRR